MKRYLLLVLTLAALLVVFISCGGNASSTTETAQSDADNETATTTQNKTIITTTQTAVTSTVTTTAALTTTVTVTTPQVPVTTTAPVTTLDTLSPAKRQELEEMVASNTAKALTLANATIDNYGSYRVPILGYVLSRYYNPYTDKTSETASVWHYTAYYAMVSRLIDITTEGSEDNTAFKELSNLVYSGFEYYSGTADVTTYLGTYSTTFYGVNRSNKKGGANVAGDQAVYDDQMWIIRELVYRYKQTSDKQYLDEAIRLSNICIKGWDYSLDKNNQEYGGIPWGPAYATKHTCSNAPIIAPLVEIYECLEALNDPNASYYLDWAVKIYDYTKTNLLDNNKLYSDLIGYQRVERTDANGIKKYVSVGLSGGDGTKYSYNTGAMISGGVALYRVTGKSAYFFDAKNSATAAYSIFRQVKGKIPYYPNGTETTWFNLVLFQGFLDFYECDPKNAERYLLSFQTSLDYAYDNYLKDGFLPRDYIDGWNDQNSFDTKKNVMDQASAAQTYAMLALWAQSQLDADNAKLVAAQ